MNELKTLTFKQAEEIARNFCYFELQLPMNEDGYSFIITDVFENGFTYIRTTEYMQCSGVFELLEPETSQYAEVVTRRFKEA